MKIKEIVSALERFAPLPLQDGFDNAGLQVGLTDVEATGALLCLDVTESVIEEAIKLGFNLIIAHHPLIFKGIKSITGKTYVERCILKAVKNDITIYAAHTNIDNVVGGVNFKIAGKIGLKNVQPLAQQENSLVKLVTFVPSEYIENVRNALFEAGCGDIGNYSCCSYSLEGEGTFLAKEGTKPFVGQHGEVHKEKEIRIETILPVFKMRNVKETLLNVHPYEEPAYDFYPVLNSWQQAGSGVIRELEESIAEPEFLSSIKELFKTGCIKHSRFTGKKIKKVALCGGSGAFLLPKAIQNKADIFITGEIKYHEYFEWEQQILMAEIGHYESEQYTQELFSDVLHHLYPSLPMQITTINTNPIKYLL